MVTNVLPPIPKNQILFRLLQWRDIALTLPQLGIDNVLSVFAHKILLKTGLYELLEPIDLSNIESTKFELNSIQQKSLPSEWHTRLKEQWDKLARGKISFFDYHSISFTGTPNWSRDPFLQKDFPWNGCHWSTIMKKSVEDFDLKVAWELSRFSWMPILARYAVSSGDPAALSVINSWLSDWIKHHPLNAGAAWSCGQEVSIRLINLLLASIITHQLDPKSSALLIPFVQAHAQRISRHLNYAIAQDNNHGTSEAAGIIVSGLWLLRFGSGNECRQGQLLLDMGLRTFEERVQRLVEKDGSFSQRSTNYHRVFLDTASITSWFLRLLGQQSFSEKCIARCRAAVEWLYQHIDLSSGYMPNFGANDGSLLWHLSNCDYRDFRPCLQLSSALFLGHCILPPGAWDEPLLWLEIEAPYQSPHPQASTHFKDGGYVTLRQGEASGFLHTPQFRFRPSQSDIFHLDMWYRGKNILCDSGTYSYKHLVPGFGTLASTWAHNTIEFDGRSQMPQLGTFLFGRWPKITFLSPLNSGSKSASVHCHYTSPFGHTHEREIIISENIWNVYDTFSASNGGATLRWHLGEGTWKKEERGVVRDDVQIEFRGDLEAPLSMKDFPRSTYYREFHLGKTLEIPLAPRGGQVSTKITLSK